MNDKASTLTIAGAGPMGSPAISGRWQPTRAGVVNSWAWADEQFLFADGWLALTGPNGSGKSLTASMLVTLLLDADWSQTALSVSGKAAGTLIARHTDRSEKEDKTGAWWLEYGRRDAATDEISYLTTGLWLRSTGGNLERAFFVAPGRVGDTLTLQQGGDPIRIDALAEQLASCGGQLFTSSAKLRTKAVDVLPNVEDERGYRNAVRQKLFHPLDEVQFEALAGVLRSLRSVRTAEAIAPRQMGQVLTDALPALDREQLQVIADTMKRIAELELQLQRNLEEVKLLDSTSALYRRYVILVAQVEAATLTAANTDFDRQARLERAESERLRDARDQAAEATNALGEIATTLSQLEGRRAAADKVLRDHSGAELPYMEERAEYLTAAAEESAAKAEQVREDADSYRKDATRSAEDARESQQHVTAMIDELRRITTDVGAESVLQRLLDVTSQFGATDAVGITGQDIDRAGSIPLAWAQSRAEQVDTVEAALGDHESAQFKQQLQADALRDAQHDEDTTRLRAEKASRVRDEIQLALVDQVAQWTTKSRWLAPVPDELIRPSNDSTDGRIDPGSVAAWLASSMAAIRTRIDLPLHQREYEKAAALANAARTTAEAELKTYEQALDAARTAADEHRIVQDEANAEEESAARDDEAGRAAHRRAVSEAHAAVAASEQHLEIMIHNARRAAQVWLSRVRQWRDRLVHLDSGELRLPDSSEPARPDDTLLIFDTTSLRLAVEQAHSAAVPGLHGRVVTAEAALSDAASLMADVQRQLDDARRSAPIPTAPTWRQRTAADGVPLWSLIDFAENMSPDEADQLEGALLVAGLLDALVREDGTAVAGDLTVTATVPAPGRSLFDLVRIEQDPDVNEEHLTRLLRAVPVDEPGSDSAAGVLSVGVLTAASPHNYRAAYIGRTTRERARLQRVAMLEQELDTAHQLWRDCDHELDRRRNEVLAAKHERDSFPSDEPVAEARGYLEAGRHALAEVRGNAAASIGDADNALQRLLAALELAAAERRARLDTSRQVLDHAETTAGDRRGAAETAASTAAEHDETAQQMHRRWRQSENDQRTAEAERDSFPSLDEFSTASQAEDDAAAELTRAQAACVEAAGRHQEASDQVRGTLRLLNKVATLPDGSLLPTARSKLRDYRSDVQIFTRQVEQWQHAAERAEELIRKAGTDHGNAEKWAGRAARALADSELAGRRAARQTAEVEEYRKLYGAEYQRLKSERDQLEQEWDQANNRQEELTGRHQLAKNDEIAAQTKLDGIAPQRADAERRREQYLGRMRRLVDEGLVAVPEGLTAIDPEGRPAHLTAALAWATHLLSDRPAIADRARALTETRDRTLTQLENTARAVSAKLARFDKQLALDGIEGTDWRHAVVAEPGVARGEDLNAAVASLRAAAEQLENDLRDDIKRTLKTSMFTQLRRDIQIRTETAKELVREIRDTLNDVRTGVARVGVQVEWKVRDDHDAQRMVELIKQPPSDESFEQMYSVLRQRMDDSAGEEWADRVAHTFDYRAWYEWKISVTHKSFGGSNVEKFNPVTARSNPLETFSTGERRLATMLPLLAAAYSMYSGAGYEGPRVLSIDEIDAAFDETNLRQVLALLRAWKFDIVATAPSMTPMIKQESQRVVVHHVVTSGPVKVTQPWIWEGNGEPHPLTLDLEPQQTNGQL